MQARANESDEEFARRLQNDFDNENLGAVIIPEEEIHVAATVPLRSSNSHLTHAVAVHEFTPDDLTKIKSHLSALAGRSDGEHKQALIEAVIEDGTVTLDFVCNPVFILGEGDVIDKTTALGMVNDNVPSPRLRNTVKVENIIPCNPIILAMQVLLNIINGTNQATVELKIDNSVTIAYKVLTPYLSKIESYYKMLPPKHQRLFNILCRGSTGHILEDPVFLPDGYLYEKSLVMSWLNIAYAARTPCYCPNSAIVFKEADITPCYFSQAVMNLIKENINNSAPSAATSSSLGLFSGNAAEEKKNSHAVSALPTEINELIEEIKKHIISLGFEPRPPRQHDPMRESPMFFIGLVFDALESDPYYMPIAHEKLVNADMKSALKDAIKALETLDLDLLQKTRNQHKDSTRVKTLLGGELTLHQNIYAKFAKVIGTVTNQPGWYVYNILNKAETTLSRLQKNHGLKS